MSTPFIQLDVNDSVGSLLIGAFFNAMLYSHELTLVFRFLRNRDRSEPSHIRIGLLILFINDTVCTAAQVGAVYLYCVAHWGNSDYLNAQHWPFSTYLITTGVSALLTQSFLIHRVYKMTQTWVYLPPLLGSMLAGFAGALWSGSAIASRPSYAERASIEVPVTVWLIGSAASDVLIAVILLVYLWRARRAVMEFEASALQAPLRRLMLSTVESGSVTTIAALAALVDFLHDKESNVCTGIAFLLGRLYALTVLFCLFQRGSGGLAGGGSGSTSDGSGARIVKRARFAHGKGSMVAGVQVHHTATVVVEDAHEHELAHFERPYGVKGAAGGRRVNPGLYMVPMNKGDEKGSWESEVNHAV